MPKILTVLCILILSLSDVSNPFVLKLDEDPDTSTNIEEFMTIMSSTDFEKMETDTLSQLHVKKLNKMKREALNESDVQDENNKKYALPGYKDLEQLIDHTYSDSNCTYHSCVKMCKVIYNDWPQHLAQCIDSDCFCFRKDVELFPPGLKEFLKKGDTFFGIRQFYD